MTARETRGQAVVRIAAETAARIGQGFRSLPTIEVPAYIRDALHRRRQAPQPAWEPQPTRAPAPCQVVPQAPWQQARPSSPRRQQASQAARAFPAPASTRRACGGCPAGRPAALRSVEGRPRHNRPHRWVQPTSCTASVNVPTLQPQARLRAAPAGPLRRRGAPGNAPTAETTRLCHCQTTEESAR
jgi:hypothetical protein